MLKVSPIRSLAEVRRKTPPRLLVVGAFPPPGRKIFGGLVSSCKALLNSSFPDRFDLAFIDSTQVSNPPPPFFKRLAIALRRAAYFVWKMHQSRPDCVLIFTASGAGLLEKGSMAWYAKFCNTPVLMFPRGGGLLKNFDHSLLARMAAKYSLTYPEKVLCQGLQWQDLITKKLSRSIHDAPIINNWTATNELLNVGRERVMKDKGKPVKLIFVGWLDREKGVWELLEAFFQLSKTRTALLELVGEGDLSVLGRSYVEENGLSDRVVFRGWLDGVDLADAYRKSDIFVLPSRAEGLPNAMIEAMAARLAIVVTAVGNIPSVILNGENGILVAPNDTSALAEALEKLIVDNSLRDRIADQAYHFARDNFGVETAVEKLSCIINTVIRRAEK